LISNLNLIQTSPSSSKNHTKLKEHNYKIGDRDFSVVAYEHGTGSQQSHSCVWSTATFCHQLKTFLCIWTPGNKTDDCIVMHPRTSKGCTGTIKMTVAVTLIPNRHLLQTNAKSHQAEKCTTIIFNNNTPGLP